MINLNLSYLMFLKKVWVSIEINSIHRIKNSYSFIRVSSWVSIKSCSKVKETWCTSIWMRWLSNYTLCKWWTAEQRIYLTIVYSNILSFIVAFLIIICQLHLGRFTDIKINWKSACNIISIINVISSMNIINNSISFKSCSC